MKKKVIVIVIVLVCILGAIGGFLFFTKATFSIKPSIISMVLYDRDLSQKDIDYFNNNASVFGGELEPFGEFKNKTYDNYGKHFTVTYIVKFKRINPDMNCSASATIDISDELKEHIFGAMYFPDKPFDYERGTEDGSGMYCVHLEGVTLGKDEDELKELMQNATVNLDVQMENGKIYSKSLKYDKSVEWKQEVMSKDEACEFDSYFCEKN